jgi:hypothetical protein
MRTIKTKTESGWVDAEWSSLVSGTVFRIYEEDGTPVIDGTGVAEFVAMSDAYMTTYSGVDVWQTEVEDPSLRPVGG